MWLGPDPRYLQPRRLPVQGGTRRAAEGGGRSRRARSDERGGRRELATGTKEGDDRVGPVPYKSGLPTSPPGTSLKKSTSPRHLPVAEIAACVVSGGFLAQSGPPVHPACPPPCGMGLRHQ
jgi:hypothetical protein